MKGSPQPHPPPPQSSAGTGAHLYLDIAKPGYLCHGCSRGMASMGCKN